MNRRELLGALGLGTTGVASFAGAPADAGRRSADVGGRATETTTGTTAGGTTVEGDGFDGIDSSTDRPFATITVGSLDGVRNPENNRPHLVRVWNDSERARTVGLELRRDGDDSALLDRRVAFPADGYLSLRLLEPANYALTVAGVGGEATTGSGGEATVAAGTDVTATPPDTDGTDAPGETVRIPRSLFDCNDSRTDVRVGPDGGVESETVTTEIGCPPAVVDRTFTAFGGTCGAADEAEVAFGGGAVAVEGSIRAPNPCYGARLAEVAVTGPDALRVTVATTEPESDFCAQCVATVEYRADVAFRDRVPGTVTVIHRDDDATRTVASVSRGAGTTSGTGTTEAEPGGARTARTETTDTENSA
ncbi:MULTISPECIES: hypothetical protein [Halorussus]|uniref:hypothetical protein n=1 Tax=Halorussus TaxID=1070314 RepID=UPI000E213FBD|nr:MULTISPECIES: hypothetical protein [Halorussus]NHN57844.1 hypothetical protein [Halorussus sp. JP-T4]